MGSGCLCVPDNGDDVWRLLHHMFRHRSIVCYGRVAHTAPFWLQVVAFAVFSVLSIYFLRPRLVAMLNAKANHRVSNADAIIGRVGEVTELVKAGGYGRVKLDGDDWKAESDAVNDIPVGVRVRIIGRESIIVKVEPVA